MSLFNATYFFQKQSTFCRYSMDQKVKKIPNNRPLNVICHLGAFMYFLHFKEMRISQSFYSTDPYYFYFLTIILGFLCHFYFLACRVTSWATKSPDNVEGLFYCNECKIYVPCRASHCKHCKRCVLRRDHHCPWTGCCIGRNNHGFFILYLIFESIFAGCCLFDLITTPLHQESGFIFVLTRLDYLFLVPVATFTFFQAFFLLLSHISLVLSNSTTWENVRHSRISYLKKYPPYFNPFSLGPCGNINEFCTMAIKDIQWEVPPSPEELGLHFDPKDFPPENSDDLLPPFKKKEMPPLTDETDDQANNETNQ